MQLFTIPHEAKAIGADSIHYRLYDRQRDRSSDNGVYRITALEQHAQAGLRSQWL
jgi:hypothetical protein